MRIKHQIVVFEAADIDAESEFWAGVLGGELRKPEPDWHKVYVDGEPRVAVQLAPGHVPPPWPQTGEQQIHLDLWVEDFAEADAHVLGLGATVLREPDLTDDPDNFKVYADPAGHPFCLVWWQ
ncbi:MAG: VOC family protein [Nocardioidaceae bacterium]